MVLKIGKRELRALGILPPNKRQRVGSTQNELRAAAEALPQNAKLTRAQTQRSAGTRRDGEVQAHAVERAGTQHSTASKIQTDNELQANSVTEPRASEQANDNEQRECPVCGESLPLADFPRLEGCTHDPDVCRNCFVEWLDNKMGSIAVDDIKCPSADCKTPVTHEDVQMYAPTDVFERYDNVCLRKRLGGDPDFRYCLRPGCSSGQIHDSGAEGNNVFRCISCGFRVCTTHDGPMHDGETCEEYDKRRGWERLPSAEKEQASREEIEKNSKKCPGRGCPFNISKTEGCDHMTCSHCRFEFCYECGAPYSGARGIRKVGNNAHAPSCRYHTDNMEARLDRNQPPRDPAREKRRVEDQRILQMKQHGIHLPEEVSAGEQVPNISHKTPTKSPVAVQTRSRPEPRKAKNASTASSALKDVVEDKDSKPSKDVYRGSR